MQNDQEKINKKKEPEEEKQPHEGTKLKSLGESKITYKEALEKPPKDKRIHPRRELRRVPEKKKTENTPDPD